MRTDRVGTGEMKFVHVTVRDQKTDQERYVEAGSPVTVAFDVQVDGTRKRSEPLVVRFTIADARSQAIGHLSTLITEDEIKPGGKEFTVSCEIKKLALNTGTYALSAYIGSINESYDYVIDIATFQVIPGKFYASGKLPEAGHSSTLFDYRWTQAR